MNWHKVAIRSLAAIFYFMLLGAIGSHVLLQRAPLDGIGSASFLFIAGGLVLLAAHHQDRARLLMIGGLGFLSEVIGVKYGWLFGHYSYTEVLAPHISDVPIVMGCAWLILIGYVKQMMGRFLLSGWLEVVLGGVWMTVIDLLLDPLAAHQFRFWVWRDEGAYYGIPWQNFIGWFVVSVLILMMDEMISRRRWKGNRWGGWVGFSIIVLYTTCSIGYGYFLVTAVGLILIAMHGVLSITAKAPASNVPEEIGMERLAN